MRSALTRGVPATLNDCQLTYRAREPIDVALARRQHRAYEQALSSLGVAIIHLPARDEHPDSVFVEDAAVVLDELAVLTAPGAPTRAAEAELLAESLGRIRALHRLTSPATLDGGDVVRVGRTLYVGRSTRTNQAGVDQLRALAAPHGYTVTAVPLQGALHLKTACTSAGRDTLLINPAWAPPSAFSGLRLLPVPSSEPWGASVLEVDGTLILPASFPQTRALLEAEGFRTSPVDLSELQKAEGGPTCLCVLINH